MKRASFVIDWCARRIGPIAAAGAAIRREAARNRRGGQLATGGTSKTVAQQARPFEKALAHGLDEGDHHCRRLRWIAVNPALAAKKTAVGRWSHSRTTS